MMNVLHPYLLAETLYYLGYTSTKADPDVWIWPVFRKVYHSHLRVVERSCTHDKDKIVS